MTTPSDPSEKTRPTPQHSQSSKWSLKLTPGGLAVLLAVNLIVLSLLAWPLVQARVNSSNTSAPTETNRPTTIHASEEPEHIQVTSTSQPPTPTPISTAAPTSEVTEESSSSFVLPTSPLSRGIFILAISEGGHSHLFSYQPLTSGLTRLTEGPWDDITPSLSPDKSYLAFASNRSGQWDLYLLKLSSGEVIRLTDTPEYDASPSWSPDGRFLAYETYVEDNLEIAIRSISEEQPPILVTNHPAADFAPTWSPQGRQLAFISTRSGDREVWLADLDQASDEHYLNLSQNARSIEAHPTWSPDGNALAWAATEDGLHSLFIWEVEGKPGYISSGDWPAWSPEGNILLTTIETPNQTSLTAQTIESGILVLPPVVLPGSVRGLIWADTTLPSQLPAPFDQAARFTPTPLWLPALTPAPDIPGGRQRLVLLKDVQAPYPQLHDLVDEAFKALRDRVAFEAGWDLLASLENAYVPITVPLPPGMTDDWLYTGRAFAFTPLPVNAGWIIVVPEEFSTQTYWRVYLRARFQDGSQGKPLQDQPWDFNIRYNGNPLAYEQGGALVQALPPGYWMDFTELATAYNWERLPALETWRSVYPAARWNEFVLTDRLDWRSAMLELYPPEALITPTVIIPPTLTLTPTTSWYRTPTPTITPTPWSTLTPLYPTPTLRLPTSTLSPIIEATSTITPLSTTPEVTTAPTPTPSATDNTPTPSLTPGP